MDSTPVEVAAGASAAGGGMGRLIAGSLFAHYDAARIAVFSHADGRRNAGEARGPIVSPGRMPEPEASDADASHASERQAVASLAVPLPTGLNLGMHVHHIHRAPRRQGHPTLDLVHCRGVRQRAHEMCDRARQDRVRVRTTVFQAGPYRSIGNVEYATAGWVNW